MPDLLSSAMRGRAARRCSSARRSSFMRARVTGGRAALSSKPGLKKAMSKKGIFFFFRFAWNEVCQIKCAVALQHHSNRKSSKHVPAPCNKERKTRTRKSKKKHSITIFAVKRFSSCTISKLRTNSFAALEISSKKGDGNSTLP